MNFDTFSWLPNFLWLYFVAYLHVPFIWACDSEGQRWLSEVGRSVQQDGVMVTLGWITEGCVWVW